MEDYAGVKYGSHFSNLDTETGIRYGVINQGAVGEAWYEESEDSEYSAEASNDTGDIFIIKSPYFTYAQFCSPCAPGAVHLENPIIPEDAESRRLHLNNNRGYCFGHDWFEGEKAPYPVYSVKTGELV